MTLTEISLAAERSAIMDALFWSGGSVSAAADRLGRNRSEFYRKCRKLNIDLYAIRAAFGRRYSRGLKDTIVFGKGYANDFH